MPRVPRKALGLRMEDMVVELLGDKDNRWDGNRATGPGEVDSEGVEEGLQLRERRRRYGIPDRPVYRRNVFRLE